MRFCIEKEHWLKLAICKGILIINVRIINNIEGSCVVLQ